MFELQVHKGGQHNKYQVSSQIRVLLFELLRNCTLKIKIFHMQNHKLDDISICKCMYVPTSLRL